MTDAATQVPATVHEAAAAGDVARLARLLAADGAAPSAHGADGWTPLHLAAHFGRADAVRLLLERGADPRAISANAMANTPLHAALAGAGDPAVVELLLGSGADGAARGGAGGTPLHLAASRGTAALAHRLLAAGADPAARSDDGRDAAAIARERGHEAVAGLVEGWGGAG